MITLKESLLDKTKSKIQSTKNYIDKLQYFGGFFDVDYTSMLYVKPINVGKMSLRGLKKHINPDVTVEDVDNTLRYCQTKAIALVNYLYGLKESDFGVNWKDLATNETERKKFAEQLEKKMEDDGIFDDHNYYAYVRIGQEFAADVCISFVRNDKWSNFTLGFNERKL